jgi:hypothetical protein
MSSFEKISGLTNDRKMTKVFPIVLGDSWYMSQSLFNERLLELSQDKKFSEFVRNWSRICVKIEIADPAQRIDASWSSQTNTLIVYIRNYPDEIMMGVYPNAQDIADKVNDNVYHEMSHAAQSILSYIKLKRQPNDWVGLPSSKMLSRKKRVNYFDKKLTDEEARVSHGLSDLEFYTNLRDHISKIARAFQKYDVQMQRAQGRPLSGQERLLVFNSFVGLTKQTPLDFFRILKEFAPLKWKKAVSEAYVELFR